MIIDVLIYPDGKLVTEVIDRQNHLCEEVYKVTGRLGTQLSDEELPDCAATAHVNVDGG